MKRILIINQNWRGDVLFSTPFIRAVRQRYPQAFIACLVAERCAAILENNPHLNQVIVLDEQAQHKGILGKIKLIKLLRGKKFDLAFLLHRSLTRTLICLFAGIKEKVGYHTSKRALFLSSAVPASKGPLHKVEYFLNIARFYGIEAEDKNYEFFAGIKDKQYAYQLLEKHNLKLSDFLVVINPGGNWNLKRWPVEKFAALADQLMERFRAKIIITGAEKDIELADQISAQMVYQPVTLCGQTSLGQLAALLGEVKLVIANDSGPMHIAVSQGTEVIALFGPTSPEITGPYGRGNYTVIQKGIECGIPCYKLDCPDNHCMKAISVEDVIEVVERIKHK